MMRWVIVLTLLLMGQVGWAAECPPGSLLTVIGTVQDGPSTEVITDAGAQVRAVRVSCGGTACVATLYDAGSNAENLAGSVGYVNANIKDEPGSPANESRWYPYDPPLDFRNGISMHDDGNVGGVLAYTCK